MRVVLADPASFTPQYDHELAAALARRGAEVELVTSRFRFGSAPSPQGYRRTEIFYPTTSRLFRRSRARLPLKVLEHPFGMAWLAAVPRDVLHVQWLAAPPVDDGLFRPRGPAIFTAHDLLPRRTARRERLWRRLLGRFHAVVVHTDCGAETLERLGVDRARLRVIPHPVFPSDPGRADDGATLLCLGVIRPYKGLTDAVEVVRRVEGARLLVAGDPVEPIGPHREAAGALAEWRLGYLSEQDVDRALGEATVALFPYRGEIDQSGALLRALGAGVPAVVYDVGGLADPVRAYGAGRVVEAGDVEALAAAARELLGDRDALDRAREGALRARAELTWDAAAEAHLELYREVA